MKYDTVIIGSGMTGLTSALSLGMRGKKVAVLEKSSSIAPLLKRFKRGNVWCDPGFHYSGGLGESEVLNVIFKSLGIMDRLNPVPLASDGFDRLYYEDIEVAIPVGLDNVKESLSRSFPKSVKAVDAYIERVRNITATTSFVTFGLEYDKIDEAPYIDDNFCSLSSFLKSVGAEDALVDTLGRYGMCLYGVPPEEVSVFMHAIIMGTFYISANTLGGGGDEIVDAFYDRLNEEGVDIFCGDAVVGVEVDEGRHIKSVVTANGKVFECDSCICTIHPGLLSNILPKKAVRPAFFSRIRSMEETPAAFALYLELDDVPAKSTHTNHFSLGTRDNYNDGAWLLAVMACGPGSYDGKKKGMCVIKKGDMALGGREFYGYPKRTNEYRDYKRSETEKILKELYTFYPVLAGNGKVVCAATPYTFERYTGTLNGSMYGIKQSVDQIKLNSTTHISGFYLAGQSILAPGVFGAAVSGLLAGANIMGEKDMRRELKKWS